MSVRFATIAAILVGGTLLPLAAAGPAEAQGPAKSYLFRENRFRHACRPPLKFAAGACVRRCPAGYQDNGGYCRLRNSSGR